MFFNVDSARRVEEALDLYAPAWSSAQEAKPKTNMPCGSPSEYLPMVVKFSLSADCLGLLPDAETRVIRHAGE